MSSNKRLNNIDYPKLSIYRRVLDPRILNKLLDNGWEKEITTKHENIPFYMVKTSRINYCDQFRYYLINGTNHFCYVWVGIEKIKDCIVPSDKIKYKIK